MKPQCRPLRSCSTIQIFLSTSTYILRFIHVSLILEYWTDDLAPMGRSRRFRSTASQAESGDCNILRPCNIVHDPPHREAAYAMISYICPHNTLEFDPPFFDASRSQCSTIIELGSGSGLVASVVAQMLQPGKDFFIATDLPEV